MYKILVPPLGWLARFADWVMIPVMYLVSGTFRESPQQTHFWNNIKLPHSESARLFIPLCVVVRKSISASTRFWWKIPLFHMPIFGGWTEYVVVTPDAGNHLEWHVGWKFKDAFGISQITLKGPVRLLIGPSSGSFFGIDATTGMQIPIRNIGRGVIGRKGSFAKLPLL